MPDEMDHLNDRLSRMDDDDVIMFFYPQENAITKKDLLTRLNPARLPNSPPPADPPPVVVPPVVVPPPAPTETLGVAVQGLAIRAEPSATAARLGERLYFNQVVEVQGDIVGGVYRWAKLLRINDTKYTEVGYVARGKTDGSETYLVPKAQVPA